MAAWLVLAVTKRKRAGGGYDDSPSTHYSWDSTVPNCKNLQPGDVIAVWDGKSLLGVSTIEAIEVGDAEKDTPYCPFCKKANVAPRETMTPVYKCWKCGETFDEPGWTHKFVTTYRSRHEAAWTNLAGTLAAAQLRALCVRPDSQLSLRELRWEEFRNAIEHGNTPTPLTTVDRVQKVIAGGHKKRVVRARIGQPEFRKALLDTYGEVCAFVGPTPAPALEAAHLYSYAATGKHHQDGGLLLRRDLHRLFDLGLIAVNPTTTTLDLAPALHKFPTYAPLHGEPLAATLTAKHMKWIAAHWEQYRSTS